MDSEEREYLLNDTKAILNSLLISHTKNGVSLKKLSDDYRDLEGHEIPYKELGFRSMTAFIKSMPEVIQMCGNLEDIHSVVLYPMATESTEHIIELVSHQSNKSAKKGKNAKRGQQFRNQVMDPRLAKRQRLSEGNDTNNGWNSEPPNDNRRDSVTNNEKPEPQTRAEDKPYHTMTSPEVEALFSPVKEKPESSIEKAKNGVDSKLWSEIFDVRKVQSLKTLPVDTNGMMIAKTALRQPLKIGEYSLKISSRSDNRLFINDNSELKYLHIPPVISQINLDLNHGYEMVKDIHWGKPSNNKIDELLKWISINRKKFMISGELVPKELHTDFVCYRGVLAKIMTCPYENLERWVICATKFRGTIYLCQFHEQYPEPDDYYNKLSFGGFRFEQYLNSYDKDMPPDPNDFDPDHHEYCAVLRTRLMSEQISHSLAFGAELDSVMPNVVERPGYLDNFVELKTTKRMDSEHQYRLFLKHKLLKWWAQSYIVGVPLIYCGYKDNKNVVKELEALRIDSFPDLCLEFWSANVCLNFLNKFLSHIKEMVTIDDPNVVYQFAFQPQQDITCTRLVEPGEFQILPEWYIKEFAV